MTRSAFVFASLALALCGFAQAPPNSAPQVPARSVPAQLAGKGLAQHDFMYTGESHDRCIFIVRHGEIVWTYDDPAGKGEISDAVMLSNGNILFAHQFGVGVITPDKKIVWALRAWGNPVDFGPSTTIQLIDQPSVPEAVHFGDLK